tara:strand:- start:212 stop:610 length:399 start_codon:yes stop_codon:yes gene_type:complete
MFFPRNPAIKTLKSSSSSIRRRASFICRFISATPPPDAPDSRSDVPTAPPRASLSDAVSGSDTARLGPLPRRARLLDVTARVHRAVDEDEDEDEDVVVVDARIVPTRTVPTPTPRASHSRPVTDDRRVTTVV